MIEEKVQRWIDFVEEMDTRQHPKNGGSLSQESN